MAVNEDFLTGDDLDDLFMLIDGGILDGDQVLNQHIESIATEIASNEGNLAAGFQCNECDKVCKSQRGLTRHVNAKHLIASASNADQLLSSEEISGNKFHSLQLKVIVYKCAEKLSNDLCFPLTMRSKFSKQDFSFSVDDSYALWCKLRPVIDSFNGDAEKFYSMFYALFIDNLLPSKFNDRSLTNTLLSEVANEMLIHLSGKNVNVTGKKDQDIPEKEMKSLQYLAGFVIHKLYTKFRFSRNSASIFNKQCCQILYACKVEDYNTQTLVDARDRGGLWKVNKKMQDILFECEKIFRSKTSEFTTSLSCDELVNETMKNCIP